MGVVVDQEPFEPRAEDDQEAEVARRELRLGEVVLRDLPADRDARAEGEPPEDRLGERAADVVEVDVDAVRARLLQPSVDVVALVVDPDVVAVEAGEVGDLLGRPGEPDDRAAPGDLRELADDLADRPGRSGDDDGVARLGLADVEEAEVGGEAGRPEDVQRGLRRRQVGIELSERAAAGDGVVLPAELPDDEVARREARILALDDLPDRLPRHRLAHLGRLRVRARRAHPPAHVRVEREPLRAHEHLAGPRRRHRALDEREVRLLRETLGREASVICRFTTAKTFSQRSSERRSRDLQGSSRVTGSAPADLVTCAGTMEPAGLEPATFWLPARRSPS